MPNRSIRGCLAALAAAFLAGKFVQYVIEDQSRANCGTGGANREEPYAALPPSKVEDKPRHPSEEEHRSAEQTYWKRSIAVTWVAVVIATVAAGFSYEAFQEARRQAKAAEDGNRAWVAVSAFKIDHLTIEKEMMSITGQVSFKNVGKSPAQQIMQRLEIVPNRIFGITATKDFCSEEKIRREGFPDPLDIAFPDAGERRIAQGVQSIDDFIRDDIAANKEFFTKFIKPMLKQNNMDENSFREIPSTSKKDHAVFEFVVVGCITYRSGDVVGDLHGTGFSYKVSTKSTKPGDIGFYFGKEAEVDGKTLVVEKTPVGAYAD